MKGVTGRPLSFSVSLWGGEKKTFRNKLLPFDGKGLRLSAGRLRQVFIDTPELLKNNQNSFSILILRCVADFRDLVEELLQQTVQPGFGHSHGPHFVGDVAHLHHDLHQLEEEPPFFNGRQPDRRPPAASTHHFLVVFVAEVKNRLDGFELVEDFVVSRHVGGQNAPKETTF